MSITEIKGFHSFFGCCPPGEDRLKKNVQFTCCVTAVLITLSCVVLPIVGAQGFFREFSQPYSLKLHGEMLQRQLTAPVLLLLLEILLGYCTLYGKRIQVWVMIFGLAGTVGMSWNVGYASHDFSHVVFQECSDFYGDVIFWCAVAVGLLLIMIWLLQAPILKTLGRLWRKLESMWVGASRRNQRILGLSFIVLCWIGLLFILGVIPR